MVDKATSQIKSEESEQTFVPETSDGTIEVEIPLDASWLDGHSLVAFESLYLDEFLIAEHKDLNDEEQTVRIIHQGLAQELIKPHILSTGDGILLVIIAVAGAAGAAAVVIRRSVKRKK